VSNRPRAVGRLLGSIAMIALQKMPQIDIDFGSKDGKIQLRR
jgi:hypothetical protein